MVNVQMLAEAAYLEVGHNSTSDFFNRVSELTGSREEAVLEFIRDRPEVISQEAMVAASNRHVIEAPMFDDPGSWLVATHGPYVLDVGRREASLYVRMTQEQLEIYREMGGFI